MSQNAMSGVGVKGNSDNVTKYDVFFFWVRPLVCLNISEISEFLLEMVDLFLWPFPTPVHILPMGDILAMNLQNLPLLQGHHEHALEGTTYATLK